MEREDVDTLIKECCDPEDSDGFIPYEGSVLFLSVGQIYVKYIIYCHES